MEVLKSRRTFVLTRKQRIATLINKQQQKHRIMRIVNLMKHAANVRNCNGEIVTLEPSGIVAGCATTNRQGANLKTDLGEFLTTSKTEYGEIENLPAPQEGVLFYVNMLVFNAATALGRTDVMMGDSGPSASRDGLGYISCINKVILA